MKIKNIIAREIFDSRGMPTIEVDIISQNDKLGRFAVPSGASKGHNEALEVRDNNPHKFKGNGVSKAINNINNIIAPHLINKHFHTIYELDNILLQLDTSNNKSILGANAILGVSIAFFKSLAQHKQIELFQSFNRNNYIMPIPLINIINGGMHAHNLLSLQEFMIVPHGAKSFKEALYFSAETSYALKDLLSSKNLNIGLGDEGGFSPNINNTEQACDYILEAIYKTGLKINKDISLAIDAAASTLYNHKTKTYFIHDKGTLTTKELIKYWIELCKNYPIISIEDPFSDNDYYGWTQLNKTLGEKIQIIGDDIFVTNIKFLNKGIKDKLANAILIKPNQIGTLSETLNVIHVAQKHNINHIISHRSGETEDTTIADLAIGTNATQIKTGALARSERVAKYNRLLRIEELLGNNITYVSPFKRKHKLFE